MSADRPAASDGGGGGGDSPALHPGTDGHCASPVTLPVLGNWCFGRATANYVDRPQASLGSGDRPPLRTPAGDPTPITHVKLRTRAKSSTGFSLSKSVPGFKSGYLFSGCRLTSLIRGMDVLHIHPTSQER